MMADFTDFIVSQAVATFLTFLRSLKGNKKTQSKRQVLKVYESIKAVYGDDPDFQ